MEKMLRIMRNTFALAFMILSIGILGQQTVNAAAKMNIETDETYEDTIYGNGMTEFTFRMPKTGYFRYQIEPSFRQNMNTGKILTEWFYGVKLYVNEKVYESNSSFRFTNGTYRSRAYNFKPGAKVKIAVKMNASSYYASAYEIKVLTKDLKNFEQEDNSTSRKASKLKLNTLHTGNSVKGDTDWWVFQAPSSGYYKIRGTVPMDYNGSFHYSVINSSGKTVKSGYVKNGMGYITFAQGNMNKNQKVYVKITYSSGNFFYKLKVKK